MNQIRQDNATTRADHLGTRATNLQLRSLHIGNRIAMLDPDLADWTAVENLLSNAERASGQFEEAASQLELFLSRQGV